jgi:hypothetical protein
VAALVCVGLPAALRGEAEAAGVVDALGAALRALPVAAQLTVAAGPLGADAYLAAHAAAGAAEPDPALRALAARQRAFVAGLAADAGLRERRCHLLLRLPPIDSPTTDGRRRWIPWASPPAPPAPAWEQADRSARSARLAALCDALIADLRPAGVGARRLSDPELAGLLYRALVDDLADRQPLPADLADLASGPPRLDINIGADAAPPVLLGRPGTTQPIGFGSIAGRRSRPA